MDGVSAVHLPQPLLQPPPQPPLQLPAPQAEAMPEPPPSMLPPQSLSSWPLTDSDVSASWESGTGAGCQPANYFLLKRHG